MVILVQKIKLEKINFIPSFPNLSLNIIYLTLREGERHELPYDISTVFEIKV